MKIALTGAAGLTGGAIAERLTRRGHEVIPILRRPASLTPTAVIADCRDVDAMVAALRGSDMLVHVAGISLGSEVAEAVHRAATPRVLAISTAAVHSKHRAAVGDYLRGEAALRSVRPDAVLLRPTMIYGSKRDRNVHHVIAFARRFRSLPVIGDGSALIQPIHFEDVAEAVAALVDRPEAGTVEAGGDEPVTLREAARIVLRSLGGPAILVPIPVILARVVARIAEAVRGGRIVERVERMLEDRAVDNTRLHALTGQRPRSFAEGVRAQIAAG